MKKRNKNISKKIPLGRTLQTRDEYFEEQANYVKPGYENNKGGNYRKVVVVDTNRKDELAVVKLTTSSKAKPLPKYKNGKSKYKSFVHTMDDENEFIKVGKKFIANPDKSDVSKSDVIKIKKDCQQYKSNRNKLRELKGRDKHKNK